MCACFGALLSILETIECGRDVASCYRSSDAWRGEDEWARFDRLIGYGRGRGLKALKGIRFKTKAGKLKLCSLARLAGSRAYLRVLRSLDCVVSHGSIIIQ